jgi:hypothetical protein
MALAMRNVDELLHKDLLHDATIYDSTEIYEVAGLHT